jgi:hypothetical protein
MPLLQPVNFIYYIINSNNSHIMKSKIIKALNLVNIERPNDPISYISIYMLKNKVIIKIIIYRIKSNFLNQLKN